MTGPWSLDDIRARDTSVLVRMFDLPYPNIDGGEGVWLHRIDGRQILDACSGGASTSCLGHGVEAVIEAAYTQARQIAYVYNHHFTNETQERLAARLIEHAAPEMARVRFVSGGSEANETALRLARAYHAERGDSNRWRIISPAQAYHGALFGTLSLTGRRSLRERYEPYLSPHLHLPPSTWRFDPTGQAALTELDRLLELAGDTIAAFFCEPVSAAALPGYSPPEAFWHGLEQRRAEHGFLICLDEVVSGMGRTGAWFAGQELPIQADIVTAGKGLGAGYAPLAATFCRQHVYDAIAEGSRNFEHGHTWDGAPLPCAVGLAVLDQLIERRLVERVRERGPRLREQLAQMLDGLEIVGEVRGRGFLLGVELVDPRDGESVIPPELDAAGRVEQVAIDHDLLVASTATATDGYAGDQVLITPAFTTSDEELGLIVERLAAVLAQVQRGVKGALAGAHGPVGDRRVSDRRVTYAPASAATSEEVADLLPGGDHVGKRELVLLGLPDVNGAIRGKGLRPAAFRDAVTQGTVITDLLLALDPLDHPITDFSDFGLRAGAGDLLLAPDLETLRQLSWRPGWQICLATPRWRDGRPCELATREVLRSVLADLAQLGYETLAAFEYEIRVLDGDGRPQSSGISYSVGEIGRFGALVERLVGALDGLGVELSAVHTEAGPGLLELNLAARPGLRAADDATFTKLAVKEIAETLGLRATFMAKITAGEEGSSGHVHLSCWRAGVNAFAGGSGGSSGSGGSNGSSGSSGSGGSGDGLGERLGDGLAPAAAAALAGMLEHLPAASLALNPTVNSYKRLVPGWFAPVNVSWGYENRSAALRVVTAGVDERAAVDTPESAAQRSRIECRRPGADANPYLALAVLVAAAADGLRRGATPPAPVTGDASERADLPALPSSLESALTAWRADATLRQLLGDAFSDYFATTRAWELAAWQQTVTAWERERYERAV